MSRNQSRRLSVKVLSELTSPSGEITIRQQGVNQSSKALDEQVKLNLTPEKVALRAKYTAISVEKTKRNLEGTYQEIWEQSSVTPALSPETYLNVNPKGSLKDILVYGDELTIRGNTPYADYGDPARVTKISDRSFETSEFDANGKVTRTLKWNYIDKGLKSGFVESKSAKTAFPLFTEFGNKKKYYLQEFSGE